MATRLVARLVVLALLHAGNGDATAADTLPARVALWLSAPPGDGRLESCAQAAPAAAWQLAQADAALVRLGQDLQLQRLAEAGSRGVAWTQRCFQLRHGTRVLLQGAVVPAESARLLPPPLPVLVLENRARHVPVLALACGFPARTTAFAHACAGTLREGGEGSHPPVR